MTSVPSLVNNTVLFHVCFDNNNKVNFTLLSVVLNEVVPISLLLQNYCLNRVSSLT